jgi:hypothetical protein
MRRSSVLALAAVWSAACSTQAPRPVADVEIALAERALHAGRIEEAEERLARVRQAWPRDVAAAQWSAVLADLTWRDDDAVRIWRAAVRDAELAGVAVPELAELQGRLGDALFQAGQWAECVAPLLAGAVGDEATRRRAFAIAASTLPFVRHPTGPISTEQRLLPAAMPEFLCGSGAVMRPFALDTGTSMTTLSRSFAEELRVQQRRPAGAALDGAGRALPIEVGVLPAFTAGDIELGAVPVAIVDDAAMELRDLHGGPERVPRGVLGLDLLGTCRLTIDPERSSIVLELPRGLPESESVQCVRTEGRCLVPVFVDDVRLWFVLDTGASHSSLTEAGLEQLPDGTSRAVPAFRRVRTVGGAVVSVREVRSLVMRCSQARFTGVTLPVVSRRTSGLFPVHGVLGVDLLGRCRVILDRGRTRLVGLP